MVYVTLERYQSQEGYKKHIYFQDLHSNFFADQIRSALETVDGRFQTRGNIKRLSYAEINRLGLEGTHIYAIEPNLQFIPVPLKSRKTDEIPEPIEKYSFPSEEDIVSAVEKISDGKYLMAYDYGVKHIFPTKEPSDTPSLLAQFEVKAVEKSNTKYWLMGGGGILALLYILRRNKKI